VFPYFGLASGFLTGKYRSKEGLAGRSRGMTLAKYMNPRGLAVLAALDDVATVSGASPAQISLAWLKSRPGVLAPITSATSVAQVEELLGAMTLTLTAGQLTRLDVASETV
jgi:aryl-alcohol dehydrogenase-like predicted oxidoreductase